LVGQTKTGQSGNLPDPIETGHEDTAADHRQANRVSLLFRAAKLVADGREMVCIIRDISETGVKARIFHAIPQCGTLLIETGNGNRFPVKVVWSEGEHAGLRFTDEVDVRWFINDAESLFPKRPLRMNLSLKAQLHSGSHVHAAEFTNISQKGGCITCEEHLLINELVRVETGLTAPIFAKVLWRRKPHYGIIFEETFRLDGLAQLLALQSAGDE
jgi:PilZ domain